MASDASEYAYSRIWKRLQEEMAIAAEEQAAIGAHLAAAERGCFPVAIDGVSLTARSGRVTSAGGTAKRYRLAGEGGMLKMGSDLLRKTQSMTPAIAVAILADILEQGDLSEDGIDREMAKSGISSTLADRTYKFAQIAWGRAFLADLGVAFPPNYVCLNAAGEVIESGLLQNEPSFAAAARLATPTLARSGLLRLALTSADVAAVNDALKKGAEATNLVLAPPLLFMEPPTSAGLAAANKLTADYLARGARRPSPWRG